MESNRSNPPTSGLYWPFAPAARPLWSAYLAWSWWRETLTQLHAVAADDVGVAAGTSLEVIALGALVVRLAAALSEAGVYALWWRGRGARLPFWRFFCWIVTISMTDLWGHELQRMAADASGIARALCVAMAGPVTAGTSASGLALAF